MDLRPTSTLNLAEVHDLRARVRSYEETVAKGPLVYVATNAVGDVLYIGVTEHLRDRIRAHLRSQWYAETTDLLIERFDTRREAEDREAELIQMLDPRYNVAPGSGRFSIAAGLLRTSGAIR